MIYAHPEGLTVYKSKTEAYAAYNDMIRKHLVNIEKSFNKYGKRLCDAFDLDYNMLSKLIAKHDSSKMTNTDEINGYIARNFPYEEDDIPVDSHGLRRCIFEKGLLSHYHNNPHHPEYWVMVKDNSLTPMPMEPIYVCEMIIDWVANQMDDKMPPKKYWDHNRSQKLMHHDTVDMIDKMIVYIDDNDDDLELLDYKE